MTSRDERAAKREEEESEKLTAVEAWERKTADEKKQERIRLIVYLRDECDHDILSDKGVEPFRVPFGCPLKLVPYGADVLYPTAKSNLGLGADALACELCKHFRIHYASKYGRGSQLRECCAKLLDYFRTLE